MSAREDQAFLAQTNLEEVDRLLALAPDLKPSNGALIRWLRLQIADRDKTISSVVRAVGSYHNDEITAEQAVNSITDAVEGEA